MSGGLGDWAFCEERGTDPANHMIEPFLSDDALLDDVRSASAAPGDESIHLWWLGQSGFLIRFQELHALLDPYLTDSLTEKYASTDKPHVRMSRRVIAPERLGFVGVVSSSHNHTDHLDSFTLQRLGNIGVKPRLVIPEANRHFVASRLGIESALPVGVNDGTAVSVGGFDFTGVPAAHEAIERDDRGCCRCLGYIVRNGAWTIYHSGDTILYEGMVETLRPFNIDVALLPINGRAPERRVAGNLNGKEAAWLAKEIGAKLVIPCHYDMFEFNP